VARLKSEPFSSVLITRTKAGGGVAFGMYVSLVRKCPKWVVSPGTVRRAPR